MKQIIALNILILSIGIGLSACDIDGDGYVSKSDPNIHYSDKNLREMFKKRLKEENIPFRVRIQDGGKEYIYWSTKDAQRVKKIEDTIRGKKPPKGRSIYIKPAKHLKPIIEDLQHANIPYQIQTFYGSEYIEWPEEYTNKVKSIKNGKYANTIYGIPP